MWRTTNYLSNEFYRLFLDQNMQYSCAYFQISDDTLV